MNSWDRSNRRRSRIGSGSELWGEINASCGRCDYCRKGLSRHCPNRTVLGIQGRDGAFADYLCLPVKNLRPVPDSVSDREAVFTEPVAAACEILEQGSFESGTPVAVLGDGKLGLLICQVLAAHGLEVTLIGHHPDRVEKVVENLAFFKLEEEIQGYKFPVVVEATGSAVGFALAQSLIEPCGILVLKSTIAGQTEVNTTQLVVDEIQLIGSRCGPFEPALKLIREKKIRVEGMIEACYSLEEGVAAFEKAKQAGICKVLLEPGSP